MTPCELAAAVSAAAISIAKCLPEDQLVLASAIFMQIGDTLATIAAQRDYCSSRGNGTGTERGVPPQEQPPAERDCE